MLLNKSFVLILSVFVFTCSVALAQNDADVLRYSTINWGSTARSLGMGNAFGALGADPSVMATNPGGLGFYRRSEFTFSPAFQLRNTSSEFLGGTIDKNSFKFNFGNLAFVWAFPQSNEKSDWKGWTLGLGYNKLNDFNSKGYAEGKNLKSSLIDSWVNDANGTMQEELVNNFPFDAGLGWDAYLFDPDTTAGLANQYISGIPNGGAVQRRTFESKGGMGEFDISVATNYMDKIYFGGSIGIVNVKYHEDQTWEETDEENTIRSPYAIDSLDFKSYNYTQSLKTEGSGFNLKFGVVVKPADFVRIGVAVHTPTFLQLTDDYKTSIQSAFEGGFGRDLASPDFIPFEYNITTPFRAIGSLGFVIGKSGLIGLEYEFVDYSSGDISPSDKSFESDFVAVNKSIQNKYTAAHNFRLGGEIRYNQLRFRLGGGYSGTPFASNINTSTETDLSRYNVNGGIGFREKNFYFDTGYSFTQTGSYSGIYQTGNDVTGVNLNTRDHRLMFTFGWTF